MKEKDKSLKAIEGTFLMRELKFFVISKNYEITKDNLKFFIIKVEKKYFKTNKFLNLLKVVKKTIKITKKFFVNLLVSGQKYRLFKNNMGGMKNAVK